VWQVPLRIGLRHEDAVPNEAPAAAVAGTISALLLVLLLLVLLPVLNHQVKAVQQHVDCRTITGLSRPAPAASGTTATRVLNHPESCNVVGQSRGTKRFAILWKAIAVRGCIIQSTYCSSWDPS
jgi:hypothetical protein